MAWLIRQTATDIKQRNLSLSLGNKACLEGDHTKVFLQKDWTGSSRHMLHLIHALVHQCLTKRRWGSTKDGHLFTENRIPEKNFGFQTKEKSLRELHMWGIFLPWPKKLLDLLVSWEAHPCSKVTVIYPAVCFKYCWSNYSKTEDWWPQKKKAMGKQYNKWCGAGQTKHQLS